MRTEHILSRRYSLSSDSLAARGLGRCFVAIVSALASAALALSISTSRTVAQPQTSQSNKPNIASEVEGGEKKTNGAEKEATKQAEPSRKQPPRRKTPPPIEVTFTTDVPQAEIFLNTGGLSRQSLGKTDSEGKLMTRLPRGSYKVSASSVGHRISSQQIDVRPGSTNFSFNLAIHSQPPTETEKAEVAPTPEPPKENASNEVSAEKALTDADEVIKRYLDSKSSADVTKDEWQRVLAQLNEALEKEPDNAQLKARALVAQAQIAYLGGDYASALISFNKAAQESSDFAVAHFGRGNAYLATNQPVEAFKAYQRATALNSELGLAYKGMGDALVKQGKQKEANQYYGRAKDAGGVPASVGLISARALKKQKKWSQALKEFQEMANTQPAAELYLDIGDCYMGLEQPLSASQAYRKAAELDPKLALAHYRYGEVMFNLREYSAATDALETALALDSSGASINRKRARELANKAAEKVRKMD